MPRNGISISWLRKLSYLKKLMRNLPYLESIFRCLHLLHSKQYHNSTPNTVNLVAIQNLTNYKIYNLEFRSCEIKKSELIFKLKYFVENWLQHHKPWWIFVFISLNLKPFKDLQKKSLNFWEHFVIIKMHNNKMFKHLKSINFVINISVSQNLLTICWFWNILNWSPIIPPGKNYTLTCEKFSITKIFTHFYWFNHQINYCNKF